MKVIETRYRGRLFRSRLEARWAVFFDALGIEWDYEREGYDLDGIYYLPDFWLPQVNMWGEVKPKPFTDAEKEKARRLVEFTGYPVLMLIDLPDFKNYIAIEPDTWGKDGETVIWYDYSLVARYLKSEQRFPCGNYIPEGEEYLVCWGLDYAGAVNAARSARFEFQHQIDYRVYA